MPNPKRLKAPPPAPTASRLVVVASDVHLPAPSRAYRAFVAWIVANRPYHVVLLGDISDQDMVSRHPPGAWDPQLVVAELREVIWEVNTLLAYCERLTLVPGNHDLRLETYLRGVRPHVTLGLKGLTFREQLASLGLDPRVEWFEESVATPGLPIANVVARHGHKQAGKFGSGVTVANTRLNKSLGVSEIVGHHHVASMQARAAHGRTAFVVTNPALAAMRNYAGSDMTWVNGFSILELRPPAFDVATPYVVICDADGGFSWGGRYYAPADAR